MSRMTKPRRSSTAPPARSTAGGGQIVKVAPWGRRRLAYQIDRYREGSYHIVLFEAPADALAELERGLQITEEVLRHLVTRVERPARPSAPTARRTRSSTTPTCRPPRTRRRTSTSPSGSTNPRARRPRPPSIEANTMALCKVDDHRQPRRGSRDAVHAERPAGHPVQRRGQPEHEEPADRRVGRGDRLVPGQRLGRSRRADRRERSARATRSSSRVASRPASSRAATARPGRRSRSPPTASSTWRSGPARTARASSRPRPQRRAVAGSGSGGPRRASRAAARWRHGRHRARRPAVLTSDTTDH